MIGGNAHDEKVIRISDQVIAKFGYVQRSEAAMQERAFKMADRIIVHVPEVYRYFESYRSCQLVAYLFME